MEQPQAPEQAAAAARVAVLGPPLLTEGACTLLRGVPWVGQAVAVADGSRLRASLVATADIVILFSLAPQEDAYLFPRRRVLFADAERRGTPADLARAAHQFGVGVLLSLWDDAATVRAGMLAAAAGMPYCSPQLGIGAASLRSAFRPTYLDASPRADGKDGETDDTG